MLGDTTFVADGAGNFYGGVGGAGAGGLLRFSVKAGYDVIVTQQARLYARGGYSTPASGWEFSSEQSDLESIGGGGRVVFRKYTGSGASKAIIDESTSLSVESGEYRCQGTTCNCDDYDDDGVSCGHTDGVVHYSALSKQSTSVPADATGQPFNEQAICKAPETVALSPSGTYSRAGGETFTLTASAPRGSTTLGIDATKTPTAEVGTRTATSCSVASYTGTESSADTVAVQCTSPAGSGTGLDVKVSIDGLTITKANAFSYRPPTITGWTSTQPAARRWTNSTQEKLDDAMQYSIAIAGTDFGTSSAAVAAKVGGRPCVSTSVTNATNIECKVPDGIGTSNAVTITFDGTTTVSTPSDFSYAPPEIHAVSLPTGHDASDGKGWDAAGGQTLTVRGVNFGSTKWSTASTAAVGVAGGTDVTVQVGNAACTSVSVVSDREITCTTPAGNGPLGQVTVTVGG